MSDQTDLQDWVKLAQTGDRSAFMRIYEQTQPSLFRLCLSLTGNRPTAEELCQDVYIKAIEKLPSLTDITGIRAWLATIARHLYLDWARSPRSKEKVLKDPANASEERATDRDPRIVLAVERALQELSPEDRMALILVDLEGYSYEEGAKIMGTGEKALSSRLLRARKRFIELFERA